MNKIKFSFEASSTFLLILISFAIQAQEVIKRTKWKFKTEANIRSAPLINGDKIYISNSAGMVYCLNKSDGDLIWEFCTNGAINGTPTLGDNLIYVVNRHEQVFAIDANSGDLIWSKILGTTIVENIGGWKNFTASAVAVEGMLYVPSGDGNLYGLNGKTGKTKWVYSIGRRIRATPLLVGDKIYQPANDGQMHVVNRNTGKLLWKFTTDGADPNYGFNQDVARGNFDSPSLAENTLVFGSRDGKTYAVDTESRKEKWRLTYGSTWAMANTIHDGTVYMGWSTNNYVCAINLETGKEKWHHVNRGHVYTKPLIVGNSVFYGCSSGELYELNKDTGEEISTYQVGAEIFSSPKIDKGIIYFGSDDGFLYAIEDAQKARMAVYLPDSLIGNTGLVANRQIGSFLEDRGFEQLEVSDLISFMNERIEDKQPSVIVYALPIIPDTLIGANPKKGLFRQYLDSGGKVVWDGSIPNFFAVAPNTFFKRDTTTGAEMLEIDYLSPLESGNYYAKATRAGLNMGFPNWLKTTGAYVKITEDIIPLAYDEFGQVSSFIKKFNPRTGSGFIANRSWAWNVGLKTSDLELVYNLATYGLK